MRITTIAVFGVALLAVLSSTLAELRADDDEKPVAGKTPLRVMSWNIRYDNSGDGDNAWKHRRGRVASVIRFHHADIVGVQEALGHQLTQLLEDLPGYASVGVGRDDGAHRGEYSPIVYREDRFQLVASDTFWLSETPRTPGSKGWDAVCPRIVTWAELEDLHSRRRFLVANTHWDHVGKTARTRSAEFLRRFTKRRGADLPILVTGDFNCPLDSAPMQALLAADTLTDAQVITDAQALSPHPLHGPSGTFIGFQEPKVATRKIDHILVAGGIRVLQHGILADHWDGMYPSDHLPVLAEVVLP